MPFEVVKLTENVYHLQSGANVGLIVADGRALVIDAGLDEEMGRRIKRTLESLGVSLAALLLTHGHADHFGGAAYLRRNLPPFAVYAPPLEAAFISQPTLEGMMLSAGAAPIDQLKGKFTLAQPCAVDHPLEVGTLNLLGLELEIVPLAGHSPSQVGVRYGDILFSADAFLPVATLQKYPVPFTVHMAQALETLRRLSALDGVLFAAGHGAQLSDAREVIAANIAVLERLIAMTLERVRAAPANDGTLTQQVCAALGDSLPNAVSYGLARTAVQAALVYLYERAQVTFEAGGLWRAVL
ncbi:MAG: MBL fold metallo-hydrolase [Chloroflexota bacterium]|jgi:glyoxylase-like metal-dependent hydrolase (beta-lactamase superfamily II)|nr:MAG: MBL fold metallo-hydrolase [Candidatus Thermofonsia Clade 1 bacterium]RMF50708.1 MAG: MBL fold metallo-hydrolase [Chloroflexota bacterium]